MNKDLNDIKETIKNIQKSIAKLEKLALDDYYDDMTLDETKARLRMAEGELQRLGYIYDQNLGFYAPENLNNNDNFESKVNAMYDDSMNIIRKWQDANMNEMNHSEQIGPLSKCCK